MIRNAETQAIKSNITAEEFGRALSAIDWSSIPPEHRNRALASRILDIILTTATDATLASQISTPAKPSLIITP